MLVLSIPAPSSSSIAARRASAAPTHAVSAALPSLPRRGERERLPGPGLPDHHGDPVAVEHEPPHHRRLLVRDRRPPLQRPLDRRFPTDAAPRALRRRRA